MYHYPYAFEFVRSIRCGWNLGNTFDCMLKPEQLAADASPDAHQTAWGNPTATRGQLEAIRDAGFDALRLPVTWTHHLGPAPDYIIEPQWLARVETIVREAFSLGFRVILNVHHDCSPPYGEISLEADRLDRSEEILCAIWKQLAAHFADLGESLIFETLNEPRIGNNWDGCPEGCAAVNRLNAAALRVIRAAGGCNAMRYVMLPTYAASPKEVAYTHMALPEDDHIIVSVHAYFPTEYCFPDRDVTWDAPRQHWGEYSDYQRLNAMFSLMEKYFIRKGVPVIIGETGAVKKSDDENRCLWTAVYTKEAAMHGIPCFWWDEGNIRKNGFGLLDRRSLTLTEPELVAVLTG